MRVLTVCREIPQNLDVHKYSIAEFIFEQNKAVEKFGVNYDYYLIKMGGIKGYIKEIYYFNLFLKKNHYNFDIIHAHGGYIGSLVNTQRKIPVVTTYHGSDINNPITRIISLIALFFSTSNIFVSSKLLSKVKNYAGGFVIPCGVDYSIFKPLDKMECRKELGINENQIIVLFAGRCERKIKNYELAKKVSELANVDNLIELKGFNRKNVAKIINASDCILLTSKSEGSPMIIKEALACSCPIVSVDVGDIKEITDGVEGVFISNFELKNLVKNLKLALNFKMTRIRSNISHLDNNIISEKIFNIYTQSLSNK